MFVLNYIVIDRTIAEKSMSSLSKNGVHIWEASLIFGLFEFELFNRKSYNNIIMRKEVCETVNVSVSPRFFEETATFKATKFTTKILLGV